MRTFHPKKVFKQARLEEERGNMRQAAAHYGSLALHLRKKKRFDQAHQLLAKAIELYPESPKLYLYMATVEWDRSGTSGHEEAKEAARAAASLAITTGKVEEYKKKVVTVFKNYADLLEAFEQKCTESQKGHEPPLEIGREEEDLEVERQASVSGFSLRPQSKLNEMIALLEKELGIDEPAAHPKVRPTYVEPAIKLTEQDRWDLAHAFGEMGLIAEAIQQLSYLKKQKDWEFKALLKEAEIQSTYMKYIEAIDCLQKTLRLVPPTAEYHNEALYQMAWNYFYLGDFEKTKKILKDLQKLNPGRHYRESHALKLKIERGGDA